jgi:hypothetical protein
MKKETRQEEVEDTHACLEPMLKEVIQDFDTSIIIDDLISI